MVDLYSDPPRPTLVDDTPHLALLYSRLGWFNEMESDEIGWNGIRVCIEHTGRRSLL